MQLHAADRKRSARSAFDIVPCSTAKTDLPQTRFMKLGVIAKFPSSTLIVGRSGSGKSTVIEFMLSNPNFMGDFYDDIWLFSATGMLDDVVQQLNLKPDRVVDDPSKEHIDDILNAADANIKAKGITAAAKEHKILLIFDDIIASQEFLKSPSMLKLACMGRHFLVSSIISTQSYTKIPRAIRLQAHTLILFPSSQDEVKLIVADHCPPHTSSSSFSRLVEVATAKDHDFLHILSKADVDHRFRRCFKTYLRVPRGGTSPTRRQNGGDTSTTDRPHNPKRRRKDGEEQQTKATRTAGAKSH